MTVPEGFVQADTRGVAIAPFPGRSTAAQSAGAQVKGGTATIAGVVRGPDSQPLSGATVQLERFVGDRIGTLQVTTGADGRYRVSDAHGGRYRVRAWLQPNFTTTQPRVEFLAHDARLDDLDFPLEAFEGYQLQLGFDRTTWGVGEVGVLSATLSRLGVDEAGIVAYQGVPAAQVRLDLSGAARVVPGSGNTGATNGTGVVTWSVECAREGRTGAGAVAQLASATIELPGCGPRPQSPTTTTPSATTTVPVSPVPVDEPLGGRTP